ncbi:hypothetical protein EDB92DRAFT_2069588 [Lactarius akahatsu]|uniref:Uncharacterized protein n=1 Tax=Lactarius akahatsu TaxID=416441 RepID=A0AAD4QBG5_9AGAM|nr:hypothetical protein EDB92DRAFT_2069588 [Lactarius akahatsu]
MGLVGDALEVSESYTSVEEFREHIESTGRTKADKLRLWTLQIPLPHVPPAVIAVAAISSRTTSSMLAQMDEDLIRVLMQREEPLCVISIGSDGAVSERKARQELMDNLIRSGEGEIAERRITHPDGRSPPIAIPLLRVFGKAMVIVQDSKHCRKTMRNNLFSGARAIVLARYATFYQQVRDIVNDTAHSPLRRRDVERVDRQDDRAAERLFSSATLNYSINHLGKSSLGLSIYLFIFGDLIDAYQSRKVSHAERAVMVLRAKFFKDLWKSFLHEGGYSAQHYFISNDADKIVDTLILSLLGLIFIHRDFLDTSFPLMPWAHGSESNEHVFGIMRSLITDFTMLDVVRMIPKLTVRLQAACRSRHQNVGETAAGYSHTYFHDEDTPLSLFSQYPSDENLNSLAGVAYDEACYLWSLLGYESSDVLLPSRSQPGGPIPDDPDDASEDSEDGATISDRRELLDAIEAIATPTHDGMSREDCSRLHEYTFAAAAFNLQDFSDIDLLQADLDPVILKDLANQVEGILKASESPHNPALATPSNSDISQSTRMPLTSSDDISFLVEIRQLHQTKEAEKGVRRKGTPSEDQLRLGHVSDPPGASESSELISERRLLARKIRDIVKAVDGTEDVGTSAGLNRQVRWTKTPGLYSATSTSSGAHWGLDPPANGKKTGNSANALDAALKAANAVIKKRRAAFTGLPHAEDISTAKVNGLSTLKRGSYGIVLIENDLMIGEVLTMYEKGGGKFGRHSWVDECRNIGLISYMVVQVWRQSLGQRCQFKTIHGPSSHLALPRFAHIPSTSFLYTLPIGFSSRNEHGIEINRIFMDTVFGKLITSKSSIIGSVKSLQAKTSSKNDEDT